MITIKTSAQQQRMRQGGYLLGSILDYLISLVKPGITLLYLEAVAEERIKAAGAKPAFKDYNGYSSILCTSVNEEVVHCVPTERQLLKGDILSIDIGLIYQGMYADCAVTVPVGQITPAALKLLTVTRAALEQQAVTAIKPGNTIGDISYAIQTHVEAAGYSVVRSLVGHGIGKQLHEDPVIPNFGQAGTGAKLKPGMTLAVEPMVNIGGSTVQVGSDGWCVVTTDKSLSAHFEKTFLVTKQGCEILTPIKPFF